MDEMSLDQVQGYADKAVTLLMEYGPKFLLAILVLFIGLRLIRVIDRLLKRGFEKGEVDPTLRPFVLNLFDWILKALLFVSVASMIGIETTSFVAILGAAGLAVGLALQGTLANFAGGVLILLFKPYRVGDLVEMQGFLGNVEEIEIFVTKLKTPTNKMAIIPNGSISNGSLVNFSTHGFMRVDLTVGVSYKADLKKTKEVLTKVLTDNPKVMEDPAPFVGVSELADSSVNFVVRPHATVENYWDVYFGVLEDCKIALDEAGIEIPFPQRDVHLIQPEKS